MVSTAAFLARVRGSVPGLGGVKETKMFLPHPRVKVSIVGSFRDREVACSASDRQGSNFESCVWRTVSSQSSHHPQELLLAQFSLYVHKGGLKPDSFHFIFCLLILYNGPLIRFSCIIFRYNGLVFRYSGRVFRYNRLLIRYNGILIHYNGILFRYNGLVFHYNCLLFRYNGLVFPNTVYYSVITVSYFVMTVY